MQDIFLSLNGLIILNGQVTIYSCLAQYSTTLTLPPYVYVYILKDLLADMFQTDAEGLISF